MTRFKNYTVSRFKTTGLKVGSSVASGTFPTTGFMIIQPKTGYTVSASKFSHGTLPSQITTCVFSDTTTAGAIGNMVKATITFASDFTLTSGTTTVNIDFNGTADLYKDDEQSVDVKITIDDEINPNLDSSPIVTFTEQLALLRFHKKLYLLILNLVI